MQRSCPQGLCDGSTFLVDEDSDTTRPCPCRSQVISRRRSGSLTAAIPRRYRGVAFEREPLLSMPAEAVAAARTYCDDVPARLEDGQGLWLWGPVGTGKTSLAMAVAKAVSEANCSLAIYQLPQLLAQIRATYDDRARVSTVELHEQLANVDFLFLDDLGAHKSSEWAHEQLFSLIDSRYAWCRPVIVTSDLVNLDELGAHLGERTVSRLRGICGVPLETSGPDMRLGGAQLRAVDEPSG